MQQIKVQGMHCDACKALINMELEENQLDKYISSIELADNNIGILNVEDTNNETVSKIKTIINQMPDYQVLSN